MIQNLARLMAEAWNGGNWETHYTEKQKRLWVNRAEKALETTK